MDHPTTSMSRSGDLFSRQVRCLPDLPPTTSRRGWLARHESSTHSQQSSGGEEEEGEHEEARRAWGTPMKEGQAAECAAVRERHKATPAASVMWSSGPSSSSASARPGTCGGMKRSEAALAVARFV
jgi:hypothetical protein